MTFRSEVSSADFAKIVAGQMIIGPRLNDPAHKKIKVGDLVLFVNRKTREERLAKIVGLLRYDSFKKLFSAYPAERFGATSKEELVESMKRLYTPSEEAEYGVLGIKIHVLKKS